MGKLRYWLAGGMTGLVAGHFAAEAWGFRALNAGLLGVAACAALAAWLGRRKS